MSSYYDFEEDLETVHEDESNEVEYRPCTRCRGTGLVWLHDQETDCLECFGDGEVPVPS